MTRRMTALAAILAGFGFGCTPVAPANGPAAVFEAYARVTNAGDIAGLRHLVDPSIPPPPLAPCLATMSGYDCMIYYVTRTVIEHQGHLTTRSVRVEGDVVYARIALRSSVTREAGVERIVGTDRLRAQGGKIVEFAFLRDTRDPQTRQYFDFLRRRGSSTARSSKFTLTEDIRRVAGSLCIRIG